jgi:hypothetical protein
MSDRKKKFETLGAAFGVAAKAATPIVLGGLGAAAGAVGLRWLAAKYMPTDYATRRWLPPALGVGGAVLGGALVSMPLVSLKTKSGREKAFKATIPLVTVGVASVAAIATLGPMLWYKFRGAYPNVALALVPPPATAQLTTSTAMQADAIIAATATEAPAPAPTPTLQLAPRTAYSLRAGGLSPSQWGKIESRAAGLRAGTTSSTRARGSVNAVNRPSNRWAG